LSGGAGGYEEDGAESSKNDRFHGARV